MANTARVNLYKIKDVVSIGDLESKLVDEEGFVTVSTREEASLITAAYFHLFGKERRDEPDWVAMLRPYLSISSTFDRWCRHDFVALIEWRDISEASVVFAIAGGSGSYSIAQFIDPYFGISVLERVFDPTINRLESIQERQLVGDVLASSRYYRRARALAFEDAFGRIFQRLHVKLTADQVRSHFPSFASSKGEKLKPTVTVAGSYSLEIQAKLELSTLLQTSDDVRQLLATPALPLFNTTIVPVDPRREDQLKSILDEALLRQIAHAVVHADEQWGRNIDFVHPDFESFFGSSTLVIELPGLSVGRNHRPLDPIEVEDVYSLKDRSTVLMLKEHIERSEQYSQSRSRQDLVRDVLASSHVHTENDDGARTTKGRFIDYIQAEIVEGSQPYFFVDGNWYRLSARFDADLSKKYRERVRNYVTELPELQPWTTGSETNYNSGYDHKTGPLYLHLVLVNNVEICDILIPSGEELYVIHVKDGLGASVRDVTSQLFIAARIVEEEIASGSLIYLEKLYDNAVERSRIDSDTLSKVQFLGWFKTLRRVYCVAVRAGSVTKDDLLNAAFDSRIAKFSLVELASSMHGMDLSWALVPI